MTLGNDISTYDIQHSDGQWVGRKKDTFAPLGSHILTTGEFEDLYDLHIWTEVNGERMQDSSTTNFIFGVDEIVLIYSQVFTSRRAASFSRALHLAPVFIGNHKRSSKWVTS